MTNLLERLFTAKHRIDPAAVHGLPADDVAELRAMVQGREKTPDRIRAIDIFATAQTADMIDVLGEVLQNPHEDPSVRAVAASQLARFGGPEAEPVLLRGLSAVTDATIRTHITAELSRVGTEAAIEPLKGLLDDPEPSVRRQAAFAMTVIAHRVGVRGFEVPPPPSFEVLAPTRNMVPFVVQQSTQDDLRLAVESVAQDAYGVRIAPNAGFTIKCGPNLFVFLLDGEHLRGGLAHLVMSRPLLLGLLAARSVADGRYFVTRLVLAGPMKDAHLYVAVYATDGTLMHFGTGHAEGDTVEFSLHSTRIAGNVALELYGRVQGLELVFSRARTALAVVDRSAPARFTPPTA